MPIESPRPEKVAVVDEVRRRFTEASATLLTEYRGLKVDELARLRQAVRTAGGDYKIYKNTLVRLAVADGGIDGLDELLTGPTAVAFVDGDAVLVAKALRDFSRTSPSLVVKGGVLGDRLLSAADAGALAEVAPREVLLAQVAGALADPLRQLAGLMAAVPRNMAYGLAALIDQRGGAPAEAPAPAADTDASGAGTPAPAAEAPGTAVPDTDTDAPAPEAVPEPSPEPPQES